MGSSSDAYEHGEPGSEIARLRDELALLRLELERSRLSEEEARERLGKARRSRARAERQAETLAKALSDVMFRHLRVQLRWSRVRRIADRQLPSRDEWTQIQLLRQSPYFWPGWYLRKNPDVVEAGREPALHFLRSGSKEARDPSPNFSVRRYVERNPEVRRAGVNALIHAIQTGATPPIKHKPKKLDT